MVAGDLGTAAGARAVVAEAQAALGGIDVLVNSAANFVAAPFDETTEEQMDIALAVNLKGPFFCAQAVAPGDDRRRASAASSTSPTSPGSSPGRVSPRTRSPRPAW